MQAKKPTRVSALQEAQNQMNLYVFSDPWKVAKHLRSVSCPNTPIIHHPSVEEKSEVTTVHLHHNDHSPLQRFWSDCSIRMIFCSKYDDPYCISRKNSLQLIVVSGI